MTNKPTTEKTSEELAIQRDVMDDICYILDITSIMNKKDITLDPRIKELLELMKTGNIIYFSDFVMAALIIGNNISPERRAEYVKFADEIEAQQLIMKRNLAERIPPLKDFE